MRTAQAAFLTGCLAALPLIGCAGGPGAVSPPAFAEYPAPPRPYQPGSAAPAAILVVLPGAGIFDSDPALWTNAGLDVLTPLPGSRYRLAADPEAALSEMMARARALAAAPIWLIGPGSTIEAALGPPGAGHAEVAGVVVTASGAPTQICRESFSYFDPGTGAKPQVKYSKSGDCPPGAGFGFGGPSVAAPAVPPGPAIRTKAPRVIEASAAPGTTPAARRAQVERLAELIKAAPSN